MDCITAGKTGQGSFEYCSKEEMNYIESYRSLYKKTLNELIRKPTRGVWSIACSNHVYASKERYYDIPDEKVPRQIGVKVKEAI